MQYPTWELPALGIITKHIKCVYRIQTYRQVWGTSLVLLPKMSHTDKGGGIFCLSKQKNMYFWKNYQNPGLSKARQLPIFLWHRQHSYLIRFTKQFPSVHVNSWAIKKHVQCCQRSPKRFMLHYSPWNNHSFNTVLIQPHQGGFGINSEVSCCLNNKSTINWEQNHAPCMDEEDPCRFAPCDAVHLKLYACATADQCLVDQLASLAWQDQPRQLLTFQGREQKEWLHVLSPTWYAKRFPIISNADFNVYLVA
jgi:hypothetical protein